MPSHEPRAFSAALTAERDRPPHLLAISSVIAHRDGRLAERLVLVDQFVRDLSSAVRTAASGVFISWAMPAVRRPSAAIFSEMSSLFLVLGKVVLPRYA